jgi:hypothetical protein
VIAIKSWNLMGGQIEWSALPLLCEVYGIDDPDTHIHALVAIRDHVRRQNEQ